MIRNKIFVFDGSDIIFTFSTGISSCNEIGKEELIIDDLTEIADKRMYKTKDIGRDNLVDISFNILYNHVRIINQY